MSENKVSITCTTIEYYSTFYNKINKYSKAMFFFLFFCLVKCKRLYYQKSNLAPSLKPIQGNQKPNHPN